MDQPTPPAEPTMNPGESSAGVRRHLDWEYVAAWLLIVAGAALRFRYLWDFAGSPLYDLAIGADVREYHQRAQELLHGVWFPAFPDLHAPLYSYFLALLLKLGGGDIPLVRAVQLVLNFGAWIAFYVLLRRGKTPTAARLTFLGVAMLYPTPVFYQTELVSESLLVPLAAGFFFLREAAESAADAAGRRVRIAGAGVMLAAMNLTHPLTLLFSAAEVGIEVVRRRYRRAALLAAFPILIAGGFCAAQSIHYGKLCGIQDNSGFNLYLGNNPDATGGCYLRPGKYWRKVHRGAALEAEKRGISADAVFLERAGSFFLRHPGKALALWGRKALMVVSPAELPSGCDPPPVRYFSDLMLLGMLLAPALFLLAGFGLWRIFRTRSGAKYIHYLALFFALYLAQIVTVTSGRYRMLMSVPAALFMGFGACDFKWRRFWWVPLLGIVGCGVFTVTEYGQKRAETALLYAEAALKKQDFRQADALATYAWRSFNDPDPAYACEVRGAAAEKFSQLALAESAAAERQGRRDRAEALRNEARRQLDLAGKHYLKMTEAEPEFYKGWMLLAILAEDAGDRDPEHGGYERAEELYLKALACEPRAADLRYNYARFCFRTGRPCAAAVAAATEVAPNWFQPWHLAGVAAMRDGDFRRAAECFWRAMELSPDEDTRRINLNNLRHAEHRMKNRK